jgi:ribosomal protein S17E
MAEAKTKPTKQTVKDFISKLPDKQTRDDCTVIAKLMEEATKEKGVMWGASIAGYGTRKVQYANGKEADWPIIGFSPRKQNLTLYVSLGGGVDADLLAKLGKHRMGFGCLYIKRLSDVDQGVLKKLIKDCAKKQKALAAGR